MIIQVLEKLNASLNDFYKIFIDFRRNKVFLYPEKGKAGKIHKLVKNIPGHKENEDGKISFQFENFEVVIELP